MVIVCIHNVNLKHLALLVKLILQFINKMSLGIMYFIQCFVIRNCAPIIIPNTTIIYSMLMLNSFPDPLFDTKENDVIPSDVTFSLSN